MTESAYPTKLEIAVFNSIMWNIQMFDNAASSLQNLDFSPAAQISKILSEIKAGGNPDLVVSGVIFANLNNWISEFK